MKHNKHMYVSNTWVELVASQYPLHAIGATHAWHKVFSLKRCAYGPLFLPNGTEGHLDGA